MRVAYFSCQMPYPATHGGLVDDWARLNAMKAAGAQLALITWYADHGEPLADTQIQALRKVAERVHALPIRAVFSDRFKRLIRLVRWPSHVSSRIPSRAELDALWKDLDQFQPEAIWLDALYPTVLAQRAARRYRVPLYYRSHNIEHVYMQGQVARAVTLRDRLAWALNLPHLRRVEFETWRASKVVFDISMDDLQWWVGQGLTNGQWLPPLVHPDKARALSSPYTVAPTFDVGYLGNLRTPNNVEGLVWLLKKVWPLLLDARPDMTMLLAGSSPSDVVREAVRSATQVTLLENPPDVVPVLRDARVLVNPVFAGSGVNVKSVEMLFTPAWLVATSQGVAGLPEHVRACFAVANDAESFADAIKNALSFAPMMNSSALVQRECARQEFDYSKVKAVLRSMSDEA